MAPGQKYRSVHFSSPSGPSSKFFPVRIGSSSFRPRDDSGPCPQVRNLIRLLSIKIQMQTFLECRSFTLIALVIASANTLSYLLCNDNIIFGRSSSLSGATSGFVAVISLLSCLMIRGPVFVRYSFFHASFCASFAFTSLR